MSKSTQSEYRRLRSLGWRANEALRAARIADEWETLEGYDLVRFRVEPDDGMLSLDDIVGDGASEQQRREIVERIERDGVNGIVAEYRNGAGEWEHGGSCWGFVGDDWKDSGYDTDDKLEAINALRSEFIAVAVSFHGDGSILDAATEALALRKRCEDDDCLCCWAWFEVPAWHARRVLDYCNGNMGPEPYSDGYDACNALALDKEPSKGSCGLDALEGDTADYWHGRACYNCGLEVGSD